MTQVWTDLLTHHLHWKVTISSDLKTQIEFNLSNICIAPLFWGSYQIKSGFDRNKYVNTAPERMKHSDEIFVHYSFISTRICNPRIIILWTNSKANKIIFEFLIENSCEFRVNYIYSRSIHTFLHAKERWIVNRTVILSTQCPWNMKNMLFKVYVMNARGKNVAILSSGTRYWNRFSALFFIVLLMLQIRYSLKGFRLSPSLYLYLPSPMFSPSLTLSL